MNILSYIIPNVLIALILVCGVITGQKRGWKKSLIKLSYTLVLAVGSFFLSSCVIVPALAKVADVGAYIAAFSTICWMLVFAVLMGIAQLVFVLVCHRMDNKERANRKEMKAIKRADVTKKTKEARKEEKIEARRQRIARRQQRREEMKAWRKAHKKSRIFGAIIGFVGALVLSVMVMVTVQHTATGLFLVTGEEKVAETVDNFYNHSIIGLIDNGINKDEEINFADKLLVEELEFVLGEEIDE